ncbi:MAG: peptidoglycan-associated lipoprotein Pal [Gammaproteobacteria bacterium]|nr:peptidoglycan-associated lipoprotein Pal [Gammaproteobacteria bacterium]
MKNRITLLSVILIAILLSACETTPERGGTSNLPPLGAESTAGGEGAQGGAAGGGSSGAQAFGAPGSTVEGKPVIENPLEDPESPLSKRTFYFDFDRSTIRPEDRPIIVAHAEYLVDHPRLHVTLAGYTDERGSREYNLALGEQRAKSVADLLLLQGVGQDQINVVSYGEERPASLGHDEDAWQQNRRVVIVY